MKNKSTTQLLKSIKEYQKEKKNLHKVNINNKTKKNKKPSRMNKNNSNKIKKIKKTKKLSNIDKLPPGLPEPQQLLEEGVKPIEKFEQSKEPINWGLGVEHEMHLFHKGKGGMKNTNILFDSQENSCFLTGEKDPQGSCKKMKGNNPFYSPPRKMLNMFLKLNNTKLTEEEKEIISYLDWELSGKQINTCEYPMVLPRVRVLMPEFVTGNFKNRTIDSINNELSYLEDTYINLQMKNPIVKNKVKKYGKLVTHLCGSHNNIKVPIRPTIYSDTYEFDDEDNEFPQKDYLGSYHVTLTLPHRPNIKKSDFVAMHRDLANQFQWIEPLITSAYFSPDLDSVGSGNTKVKGSYRVMSTGWGNFAGADVRKFGNIGVTRGSNIRSYWRDKISFPNEENEVLNYCTKTAKPIYKKSKSILSSDFRTFNFIRKDLDNLTDEDLEKCQKLHNPVDCPKIDGGPMEPSYGVEIRVFDHFPKEYLLDLLRILILLAGNSKRNPPKGYVYKDASWISAMTRVMKHGWNAILSKSYVEALRKNLGLPIKMPKSSNNFVRSESMLACDIFCQVVDELFEINKDSFFNQLMNENPNEKPIVPKINRKCWENECDLKWMNKLEEILKILKKEKNIKSRNSKINKNIFEKYIFKHLGNKENWKYDIDDLLYTLESNQKVRLIYNKFKISHFNILL